MKTIKKKYMTFLLISISTSLLFAQGSISYQEYITKIEQQLPQIQKSQLLVNLAENKIDQEAAVTDPVFEFNTSLLQEYQYNDASPEPNHIQGVNIGAGLTKKNINNGTTFGYGTSVFLGDYKIPQVYVNYSYPIFYNASGIQDKFKIYAARNNFDIEKWKQQDIDALTLNQYKKIYFQWIKTISVIDLLENNIENAQKLKANTKSKYRSGLADLDDVEKVENLVIKYQAQLEQYQIYLKELLASMMPYINAQELFPNNKDIIGKLSEVNDQTIAALNIENHPSFKMFELQKQYFDEYNKVLKNGLLPKTDLNLQVALKGRDENFGQAVNNMQDVDYTAGVVFSIPLDKAKAKADLKAMEISRELLDQDIRQNTDLLNAQKGKFLANISGLKKQLELSSKNLKSLQKRYQLEKNKYEKARLNLSYLIETQNDIIAEKINSKNLELGIIFNYFDLLIIGGRK